MIALTQTERMAVDLLSGELRQLLETMQAVEQLLTIHADDISEDAAHWVRDGAQTLSDCRSRLRYLLCEDEAHGLAVWLEPSSLERYCEACANSFETCPHCQQVFSSRDIVTCGEETGCASCVEPDEDETAVHP